MRSPATCAFFLMALCLATPAAAQPPRDLRCQNAINPRGVEAARPQLSWTMNPNAVQRAYQVLVATSEEKLKAGEADLWDSGRVLSDKTTVQYRGKPLASLQRCYWKVRVWGNYYTVTLYSDPAAWDMAVLSFGDRKK